MKKINHLKKFFLTLAFAAITVGTVSAVLVDLEFPGWHALEGVPDVIVARCLETPDPYNIKVNGITIDPKDGLIESDMDVIRVLKGGKRSGHTKLTAQYWPRHGEYYLIFANYHDGFYQAIEPYRTVPLGVYFPTNSLSDKPLDEQVKELLRYRLSNLNQKMKDDQIEKQRLEDGLKN